MTNINIRKKLTFVTVLAVLMTSLAGCGSTDESGAAKAVDKSKNKMDAVFGADNGDTAETAAAAEGDDGGEGFAADEAEGAVEEFRSADGDAAEGLTLDAIFDTDTTADAAMGEFSAKSSATAGASDGEGIAEYEYSEDVIIDDPVIIDPVDPEEPEDPVIDDSQPFILTAGQWNDNENWGFFSNLVKNETITFPAFGIDPRNRVAVKITKGGEPAANEKAQLLDKDGKVIWSAVSDKNGNAYLFYGENDTPEKVKVGDKEAAVSTRSETDDDDQQGSKQTVSAQSVEIETEGDAVSFENTEVMFILDTTGSMSDEIAYLQKDFSSIAEEVNNGKMTFSVNFYRDEGDDYVTKCNPFTDDVKEVQSLLNAESADGGGDFPEAVADVLEDTITKGSWSDDTNKIAFLIFDAPPHDGKEETLQTAIKSAAEQGVHLVPVVASNSDRETELFGRAIAICTGSNYVFLTDDSGVGGSHLEPIIGDYDVELLHDIIVRNINEIAG